MVHDDHYEPPPKPKVDPPPTPDPTPKPTPKPTVQPTQQPTTQPNSGGDDNSGSNDGRGHDDDPGDPNSGGDDDSGDTTPTTTPTSCSAKGQYAYPERIWIVDTSDGQQHVTEEQQAQDPGSVTNGQQARWERTGNCFTPVLSEGRPLSDFYPQNPRRGFRSFWNDLVQVGRDSWDEAEAEIMAVVRAFDDYLCQDYLWTGGLTAGSAATSEGARHISNARLAAQAAGVARAATITGVAVLGACIAIDATNVTDDSDSDSDSDTDEEDEPDPTPEPTPSATPDPTPEGDKMTRDDLNRAQKRFSDGEISVDEYKAIVFRWNCQQYGRFCDR